MASGYASFSPGSYLPPRPSFRAPNNGLPQGVGEAGSAYQQRENAASAGNAADFAQWASAANAIRNGGAAGSASSGGSNSSINTLRNVKNPTIQSGLDAVLSRINGLGDQTQFNVQTSTKDQGVASDLANIRNQINGQNFDPNVNPYVLRSNVKDAAQNLRIQDAGTQFDQDKGFNRSALDTYASGIAGSDASVQANKNQEQTALGSFYGNESDPNSVLGRLKALNDRTTLAVHGAGNRALDVANRNQNLGLLTHGAGSYANQQALDTAAGVRTNEAVRHGQQSQQDLLYTLEGQKSLAGARQKLEDEALRRRLLPIEARTRLASSETGQLGDLGRLQNLNNQYTLESPDIAMARKLGLLGEQQRQQDSNRFYHDESPETAMARRLGLLQGVTGLDQSNNFYGLGGNFPSYRPPTVNYGGNSGYPYPDIPPVDNYGANATRVSPFNNNPAQSYNPYTNGRPFKYADHPYTDIGLPTLSNSLINQDQYYNTPSASEYAANTNRNFSL